MAHSELSVKGTLLVSDSGMLRLKPLETTPVVMVMSVLEKISKAGVPVERLQP